MGATLTAVLKMLVAAAVLAAVAYLVWRGLDELLGRSLVAQLVSVGTGLALGTAAYAAIVLGARVAEAQYLRALVAGRLRRRG